MPYSVRVHSLPPKRKSSFSVMKVIKIFTYVCVCAKIFTKYINVYWRKIEWGCFNCKDIRKKKLLTIKD